MGRSSRGASWTGRALRRRRRGWSSSAAAAGAPVPAAIVAPLLSGGFREGWVATDEEGRFEFALAPGTYVPMFAFYLGEPVDLAPGRPAEIEVRFPSGRAMLSGRLAGLLGVDAAVAVESAIATSADTAELDGAFRFPALPPGTYRVTSPGFVPQEVTRGAGEHVGIVLEPYAER